MENEVRIAPKKKAKDLHSALIAGLDEARKYKIAMLGKNSSIGHAIAISNSEKMPLIGIHDDTPASAQEAFAVAIRCLAEEKSVIVLRHNFDRRSIIPEGMTLYGTGGFYDHGKDVYDPGPEDALDSCHPNGTPYTPCGLAWHHHGNRALLALGCPTSLISNVKEHIAANLIRSIDYAAIRQAHNGVWTVADAIANLDFAENQFDDSAAAFVKMAEIAKHILMTAIMKATLVEAGEEGYPDEDMDLIWHYIFAGANNIENVPTLVSNPKRSWQELGYDYLRSKGLEKLASRIYVDIELQLIPTMMGQKGDSDGLTMFGLMKIFGHRYADDAFDIAKALFDAYIDSERRLYQAK